MKTYCFKARIEVADGGGAYILFPYDVEKEFGARGRIPVKVAFDGVSYTGTMIKYGHPQHMLPILKAIREQIGKTPGDIVDVELHKDESVRVLEVPDDFAKLLKTEKLQPFFDKWRVGYSPAYKNPSTDYASSTTTLTAPFFENSDPYPIFAHEFRHIMPQNNALYPGESTYIGETLAGRADNLDIERDANQFAKKIVDGCPCGGL